MIASFGGLVFKKSLDGFIPLSDFEQSFGLDTDVQDQANAKPSTLVKGPSLEEMGFTLRVYRQLGVTPEQYIAQLRSIMAAAVPQKFVLGGKPVGDNLWLLKEIAITEVRLNGKGEMLTAVIALSFEEFVRPGVAQVTGAAAGSSPGVSFAVDDAYKVSTSTAEEKTQLKREGR